ncbi:MAG: cupin fold metalloprotein, WbuC family [Chlamydiia bacterium]|nr:cupin fold metalloprotein, WbuC family [Chlamydiia bacterium]
MKALNTQLVSAGVWNCTEKFPRFSKHEIPFFMKGIDLSPTLRSRVCMHSGLEDRMQEMFIAFSGKTYVRPSFHHIDESFHVIEGFGKYLFFDAEGRFTHDVRLGPYHSELPFYCRIPKHQAHSLILFSKNAMAHEIISGPFSRANTIFPAWSADLQTDAEKEQYRAHHATEPVSAITGCQFDRITEEMCRAKPGVVTLKRSDLEYLKSEVYKTTRKRIRLCIHLDDQAALHEMFVVYTDMTYVRPNLHIGKDESLHILEGEADFIFFDETGKVTAVIPLGDQYSHRNFFVRVPQGVYHTIIMRSNHLIIHEATPGPFDRKDTLWAPWAPLDSDQEAVTRYQQSLEKQIAAFRE